MMESKGFVGVDHLGRAGDGLEGGVVPVGVVLEGRRHLGFGHVDDVGPPLPLLPIAIHIGTETGQAQTKTKSKNEKQTMKMEDLHCFAGERKMRAEKGGSIYRNTEPQNASE